MFVKGKIEYVSKMTKGITQLLNHLEHSFKPRFKQNVTVCQVYIMRQPIPSLTFKCLFKTLEQKIVGVGAAGNEQL